MEELKKDNLKDLIENKQYKNLRQELVSMAPAEIVELMASVPSDRAVIVFRLLPKDFAVEVFDRMDGPHQNELLESFSDQAARTLLESMEPDDRTELIEELPAMVTRKLLQILSPEQRRVTLQLLGYEEKTAGREMNPSFVDLHSEMTVSQALNKVRRLAIDRETIYECYVMNQRRQLEGTVSLKDLVIADPDVRVADIMKPDPLLVHTSTDREDVARILRENDLLAVPVVDSERRLVGIITHDDVADILKEEATEDIYRFGAVPGTERGYFTSRIFSVVKRRIGWLFLLILVNTVTGSIIAGQESMLAEIVILAAFIPLLIDTGGNVGSQSATVVIRGLATGEVRPRGALRVVIREAGVGAVLGLMLGAVVCIWAYVLGRDLQVAAVVSTTLVAISIMATLAGGALPFAFRLVKLDPALVSAPFITTIMDIFGVGLYFFIAHLILSL